MAKKRGNQSRRQRKASMQNTMQTDTDVFLKGMSKDPNAALTDKNNDGTTSIADIIPINIPSIMKGSFMKVFDAPISWRVSMTSFLEYTDNFIVLYMIRTAINTMTPDK